MRTSKLIFPLMILFLAACAPMQGKPPPAAPAAPSAAGASPVPASATPMVFTPTAPAAAPPREVAMPAVYPDLGPAPEIVGDVWLNVGAPLRLADRHGKVTLIDMWTFG